MRFSKFYTQISMVYFDKFWQVIGWTKCIWRNVFCSQFFEIIRDKLYIFFNGIQSDSWIWNTKQNGSKHKAESTHCKVIVWVLLSLCRKNVKWNESDGWNQNTVSYLVLNFCRSPDPLCMVFEWLVVVVSLWSFLF